MAVNREEADRLLEEANDQFAEAFGRSDMAKLMTFYTPDCMIRPDRMEPFVGLEGAKNHLMNARKSRDVDKIQMDTATFWESHVLSDTAAIHGCSWKAYDADGKFVFTVLDMALWKLVDGQWKIYRGGWTS